jgi:hypothetical protein
VEEEARQEEAVSERSEYADDEEVIVAFAHAVVEQAAVMVQLLNATTACDAVPRVQLHKAVAVVAMAFQNVF